MTWVEKTTYYGHEVSCPNCGGEPTERYVLTDEAGTENYVMDRHLECGWERIYMPELLNLVEGRKMNWKTRINTFTDSVKRRYNMETMNAYEIFGRLFAMVVALLSVSVLGFTWIEGLIGFPTTSGWPVELVIALNALGAYMIYRNITNHTKKEK